MDRDRDVRINAPQGGGTQVPAGAVPVRTGDRDSVVQQTQIIAPQDRVRWGPIWAGLLTALSLFLLGSLIALALGALSVDARAADADDASRASGIASAVIAALAFGIGGFIAAKTAAARGRGNGLLNGFLVWALAVPLLLYLASQGLGALLGAAGNLFDDARALANNRVGDVNVNRNNLVEGIKNGALGASLGMLIPAITASLGGLLGARDDRDEHHHETRAF